MLLRRTLPGLLALLLVTPSAGAAEDVDEPIRISDALPERFALTLASRVRYEYLFDQFRIGTSGDEDLLVLRTVVHGRVRATDWLHFGAELLDARAYGQTNPVSTGIVNAVELLRGYAELDIDGLLGGRSRLSAGRITMDVGDRRFVARNRYRNTINAFTGLDWEWRKDERRVRAFWVLPILRRPFLPEETQHNRIRFDRESLDVQFWGLYAADVLPGGHRGEVFVFGIHEDDSARRPTDNRQLYTPGFRLWKTAAIGRLDYQWESAFQFGRSRSSFVSTRDLDHFAHFHHVELGYSFATWASPRLVAQFDYASGDRDPADGKNGRFDTLYGARRFDFGPTGIYGPFFRANLVTPGVRLAVRPHPKVTSFVAVRAYWLAEARDAWIGTGLRDRTGSSGTYLGTQAEIRVRWSPWPGNFMIEFGYAYLFAGSFRNDAPQSNGQGNSSYLYTAATVSF